MKVRFVDIPFEGDAIALHNGKVIWTNHNSGDCPPDISMMTVASVCIIDGQFVFELEKGD